MVDVKGPGGDLMLVAVLDLAGDLSLAEPAKEALAADIDKLPPRTTVAVMRAQDGAKVLADPGADRAAAVSAVRDLPVSGKAGLLEYRGNGDGSGGFDPGQNQRARGRALCDRQRPGELSRGFHQPGDQFERHARFEPEASRRR